MVVFAPAKNPRFTGALKATGFVARAGCAISSKEVSMNEAVEQTGSNSPGEVLHENALYVDARISPLEESQLDQTLTSGGRIFNYGGGPSGQIDIVDIATSLGNMCRFAGHVRTFYSVAEHSVLVSLLVPPTLALQGLLHDAHEAYALDVPTPLKSLLPDYRVIEDKIATRVRTKLGVPLTLDKRVKEADWVALHIEREQLLPPHPQWVTPEDLLLPARTLNCYPPHIARAVFLQRYYDLMHSHETKLGRDV